MKQLIFLFSILLALPGYSQSDIPSRLAAYLQAQTDVNGFSGAVLVANKDTILLQQAYGLANYDWKIRNTPDTKFGLASVSKQFTAVAILQLVESGKLSLDSRLNTFFSGFPKGDTVTIHMLLAHTSGLDADFDELYLKSTQLSNDSVLAAIEKKPYLFSPGTACSYSNIGYFLLARIIEQVSGEKYADYLQKHLFSVADMRNSGVTTNDAIIPQKASFYCRTAQGYVNNPYINWEVNIGHDGIYSTVEDLYRWNKALFQGRKLISEASKTKMFTPYNDQHFGYGLIINPPYNQGHQLIAHDGGFFGVMSSFNWFSQDHLFVVVLSNNQSPSYLIAPALAAIVFGKPVTLPYHHVQVPANTQLYDDYVGKYENINILKINGKLCYNDEEIQLLPESDKKFFRADNPDRTIEFLSDKKGRVHSLLLTNAGLQVVKRKGK